MIIAGLAALTVTHPRSKAPLTLTAPPKASFTEVPQRLGMVTAVLQAVDSPG